MVFPIQSADPIYRDSDSISDSKYEMGDLYMGQGTNTLAS